MRYAVEDVRMHETLAGIEPLVDSVMPLADAREGFARMVEGQVTGKVVFTS